MMLFTHNVNKIKSVARKNGEIDGTCKQDFRVKEFFNLYNIHVPRTVKLLQFSTNLFCDILTEV